MQAAARERRLMQAAARAPAPAGRASLQPRCVLAGQATGTSTPIAKGGGRCGQGTPLTALPRGLGPSPQRPGAPSPQPRCDLAGHFNSDCERGRSLRAGDAADSPSARSRALAATSRCSLGPGSGGPWASACKGVAVALSAGARATAGSGCPVSLRDAKVRARLEELSSSSSESTTGSG
jgi:hypothetical protein